jgi:LacI family transcriptional regulator
MISSLELARLFGVSHGTVDRALHGRSGISEKTRSKILAAAELHGYVPNPAAREIITGESKVVGALLPQMNSVFFMDLFNEVKECLRSLGFRMIFAAYSDEAEFLELLDEFSARRLRGVVFAPPHDGLVVPARISRNTKLVSLLSPVSGDGVSFVSPDENATGALAAEHLIACGRKRLLHITYPRESHAIIARKIGFERVCGCENVHCSVLRDPRADALSAKLAEFKPDGIFCHNDWLALSTLRILEREGLSVPESVSIIGVDDSPTFNRLNNEITTIPYPYAWCADEVVAFLNAPPLVSQHPKLEVRLKNT